MELYPIIKICLVSWNTIMPSITIISFYWLSIVHGRSLPEGWMAATVGGGGGGNSQQYTIYCHFWGL